MVTYMLPIAVEGYVDERGRRPIDRWFGEIDDRAARRIALALERLAHGNISNVKSVGGGVSELKVNFGPGYRVYFGRDGDRLIVLLAGGTKKRQSQDIARAKTYWADYKSRKAL